MILLALTVSAQAADIGAGVWLGEYAGQADHADQTGTLVGVRARLRPSARWAAELGLARHPGGNEALVEALVFAGDPCLELVAFLAGGAGVVADETSTGVVSLGPGVDILLAPRVDLRLDARARLDGRGDVALVFGIGLGGHGASGYDLDGDGITGRNDACPELREDRDGFQDEDGCPDLDDDLDGLPDVGDPCPRVAEDRDGFLDGDGCPEPDNDGDGLDDRLDACIVAPEDKDGFQDGDGCPELDNDRDGVPDEVDACPLAAEDADGHADVDGCDDPDNDGDGVPDAVDAARDLPETVNGWEDTDGAPDVLPRALARFVGLLPRVQVVDGHLTERAEDTLEGLSDALETWSDVRVCLSVTAENLATAESLARVLLDGLLRAGITPERAGVVLAEGAPGVRLSLVDRAVPWPLPGAIVPAPAPAPEPPLAPELPAP